MKVGVLSDTHGRFDRVRDALSLFDSAGVEAIFHCGDVGGIEVLEQFVGRRFWFVWGNMDRPEPAWRAALQSWGLPWPEESPVRVELAGRSIVLLHGCESVFARLINNPDCDFLFYGHTHRRDCVRVGTCLEVNPGAIHNVGEPTIAVVDLDARRATFLNLQGKVVDQC